jgi:hypothetical protein
MIGGSRRLRVGTHEGAEHERRNATASTDIRRPFVKRYEDHAVPRHGCVEERPDERAQPVVARRDITVVHVVTEIGRTSENAGRRRPRTSGRNRLSGTTRWSRAVVRLRRK